MFTPCSPTMVTPSLLTMFTSTMFILTMFTPSPCSPLPHLPLPCSFLCSPHYHVLRHHVRPITMFTLTMFTPLLCLPLPCSSALCVHPYPYSPYHMCSPCPWVSCPHVHFISMLIPFSCLPFSIFILSSCSLHPHVYPMPMFTRDPMFTSSP